jgi:hypothetical protein
MPLIAVGDALSESICHNRQLKVQWTPRASPDTPILDPLDPANDWFTFLKHWFTSSRCYGNYDVIKEIRTLLEALPCHIPCHRPLVKGHQAQKHQIDALPLESRCLNEHADSLATDIQKERIQQLIVLPVKIDEFPNQSVTRTIVLCSAGPITGDPVHHIRTIRPTTATLAKYYQDRFEWTPGIWDLIHHEVSSAAIKKLSSPDQHQRVVQQCRWCGWLPTNKRVPCFVSERPTTCPRCRHCLEAVDHLLRCPQSEPLLIDFINDTLALKLLS